MKHSCIKRAYRIVPVVSVLVALMFGPAVGSEIGSGLGDSLHVLQAKIDSLESVIDNVQQKARQDSIARAKNGAAQSQHGNMLADEIRFLRFRIAYVLDETIRVTGADPMQLYLAKLGDSNFVSNYGHLGEPYPYYIAAERLGAIGKPAIPHLMKRIEGPDSYERRTVFYALSLASGHDNVRIFAGRDTPPWDSPYDTLSLEQAWRIWYDKYSSHWDTQ